MSLSGNPIDYVTVFLGGVLVSFTPCVYPLIPISAGYIGITAGRTKHKGLFLSLVYVTGVAITYSILGLVASLSGTIFGKVSVNPITSLFVGIIIILFGLSMLDLWTISLPKLIRLPTFKKQNYFSTFILGLSSGLIVSPCVTSVLSSILVYLTTKKNLLYGATLLFTFAYGMGLVLILASTFSSILVSLPRSGRWMVYIKRFYAFILIGMGIYFIWIAIRRF